MNTTVSTGIETKLPLSRLAGNPDNPRVIVDKDSLAGLAASMKAVGLIQPVIVRPKGQGFEIVAGHRRCSAARTLGWTEIAAVVRDIKDEEVTALAATENLQRDDMHPLDEALACRRLTVDEGRTQADAAAVLGKSQGWVAQRLSLLGLSAMLRKQFKAGKFSVAVGLVLARVPNAAIQDEIFKDNLDEDGYLSCQAPSLAEIIYRSYTCALSGAPFDTRNPDLVPKAGTCLACPKRSGACADLFPDLQKKSDLCLDGACWSAKLKAQQDKLVKEAKAAEHKVLEGEAGEKAAYSGDYVRLDDTCNLHPKRWNWRKVLTDRPFETVLIVGRRGAEEYVSRETAKEAATALLPKREQAKAQKEMMNAQVAKKREAKERKAHIEKAFTDREYTYESARQLAVAASKAGFTRRFHAIVLDHLLKELNHDGKRHACALFGLEAGKGEYGQKDYSGPLQGWRKKLDEKAEVGAIFSLVTLREAAFSTEPLKKLLTTGGLKPEDVFQKAVANRAAQKEAKLAARKTKKK